MNKHTPGPWLITTLGSSGCTIGTQDKKIASVLGDDAKGISNARLITAAPDLLAALQAMVQMFELHINGQPGPDDAAERWDRARAAIAKATCQLIQPTRKG